MGVVDGQRVPRQPPPRVPRRGVRVRARRRRAVGEEAADDADLGAESRRRDLGPRIGDGRSGVPAILERRGRGGRGQRERRRGERRPEASRPGRTAGERLSQICEWPSVPSEIPMLASRHDRRAPPRRDRAGDARLPRAAPRLRRLRRPRSRRRGRGPRGRRALAPDLVLLADPLLDATALEVRCRLREGERGRSWDRRARDRARPRWRRRGGGRARRSTAAPTTCCCGRSPTTSCLRGSVRSRRTAADERDVVEARTRPDRPRNPPRHRARVPGLPPPPRSTHCC